MGDHRKLETFQIRVDWTDASTHDAPSAAPIGKPGNPKNTMMCTCICYVVVRKCEVLTVVIRGGERASATLVTCTNSYTKPSLASASLWVARVGVCAT